MVLCKGNENGDLCAYQYGTQNWHDGYAKQMWTGHFQLIQTEYSDHTGECLKAGP